RCAMPAGTLSLAPSIRPSRSTRCRVAQPPILPVPTQASAATTATASRASRPTRATTAILGIRRLLPMLANEVTQARIDDLPPAPAAEDAVVPGPGHLEMRLFFRRNSRAQCVRRCRLPVAGNIVEFTLDGEQGRVPD